MNKIKVLLPLAAISSFAFCLNASALENIEINSEQDYFNAIATINTSSETDFVVNLGSDITLTSYPSTSNPATITNNKTVTFLGNDHKIKISETGSYGSHEVLTVGNATVNLGNSNGNDTLYIEGGGPNVNTSASLIQVSGTLNIYANTDISNNHSGSSALTGAAIRIRTNGTVNMYGGKIHDNSATSSCMGGAIMLDYQNGTFNMYDCLFENNRTCTVGEYTYGGAIMINDYENSGSIAVNIEGGTFRNNTSGYGGAIVNLLGKLSIKNATFENNTATNSNGEEAAGGAILQYSNEKALVDNVTFKNNNAESGGAIYVYGGRLDISNSTLKNNTAINNGGAVRIDEYGTFVSTENIYEENSAKEGGAIYNVRSLYTEDDLIDKNTATIGGGIYVALGNYNVIKSKVYNNKATSSANDIYIAAAASGVQLADASAFDASATFDGKSVEINGWYEDRADSRYSLQNQTDLVPYDSITTGNKKTTKDTGEITRKESKKSK